MCFIQEVLLIFEYIFFHKYDRNLYLFIHIRCDFCFSGRWTDIVLVIVIGSKHSTTMLHNNMHNTSKQASWSTISWTRWLVASLDVSTGSPYDAEDHKPQSYMYKAFLFNTRHLIDNYRLPVMKCSATVVLDGQLFNRRYCIHT